MQELPVSGLYIVTLNNEHLISVNAHDKRHAEKAIKVNREHCKFGKAKVLAGRRKNYYKTFGQDNVNFKELVRLVDIQLAEQLVLNALDRHRIRGVTGRKNEWLAGISASQVQAIIIQTLDANGINYHLVDE